MEDSSENKVKVLRTTGAEHVNDVDLLVRETGGENLNDAGVGDILEEVEDFFERLRRLLVVPALLHFVLKVWGSRV